MQGFILGLASGATCLAYCAPVLIPFFLGEGKRTRQNWGLLAQFLGGRLAGYLLFGLLAWLAYRLVLGPSSHRALIFGGVYVLLAGLLAFYGLRNPTMNAGRQLAGSNRLSSVVSRPLSGRCVVTPRDLRSRLKNWPALFPVALGFFTGLNLCPPFLAAFANASYTGALLASLLFFAAFFLGTSLFFVPIPFLGAFSHIQPLRIIGKYAAIIMALYYLYSGIMQIAGGIAQL